MHNHRYFQQQLQLQLQNILFLLQNMIFGMQQGEAIYGVGVTESLPPASVVIFSFETFHDSKFNRPGGDRDRKQLTSTFKDMGFDVKFHIDLSKCEVVKKIDSICNQKQANLFLCIVLSHGVDEHSFLAHDGERICLKTEIANKIGSSCNFSSTKKVYLSNFCRTSTPPWLATQDKQRIDTQTCGKDSLFVYSSLPGQASYRDCEKGSLFVQHLVHALKSGFLQKSFATLISETDSAIQKYLKNLNNKSALMLRYEFPSGSVGAPIGGYQQSLHCEDLDSVGHQIFLFASYNSNMVEWLCAAVRVRHRDVEEDFGGLLRHVPKICRVLFTNMGLTDLVTLANRCKTQGCAAVVAELKRCLLGSVELSDFDCEDLCLIFSSKVPVMNISGVRYCLQFSPVNMFEPALDIMIMLLSPSVVSEKNLNSVALLYADMAGKFTGEQLSPVCELLDPVFHAADLGFYPELVERVWILRSHMARQRYLVAERQRLQYLERQRQVSMFYHQLQQHPHLVSLVLSADRVSSSLKRKRDIGDDEGKETTHNF